jgi:hypothetical protein
MIFARKMKDMTPQLAVSQLRCLLRTARWKKMRSLVTPHPRLSKAAL